jgi:putative RNA 2'-phosphotransferase
MSDEAEKKRSSLSKFLSLLLRHNPGILNLSLDNDGWLSCSVQELEEKIKAKKDRLEWVTVADIKDVVDTDPKGRYEINDQNLIRATYGHSIKLNPLDFPDDVDDLPEFVYYAGSNFELDTMLRLGLIPRDRRDRQYLHLSIEMKDAYSVAKNYTRYPRLIKINIPDAIEAGIKFKKVSKFIVVCDEVPPQFLEEIELPEELQYLIHEKPQKFQNRRFRSDGKPPSKRYGSRARDDSRNDKRGDKPHGDRRKTFSKKPYQKNKPQKQNSEEKIQSDSDDDVFPEIDNDLADQFNEIDDIKKKAKSKSTIHFETDDDFEFSSDN